MPSETCANRDIVELLPWYLNGTLAEDERRAVERHLQSCPSCRREIGLLRTVTLAMGENIPVPSGDLYARTRHRLEPRGVARWVQALCHAVLPIPAPARLALAAQFLVIIVLLGALIGRGTFTTLSGPDRPTGPGVTLQVIYRPDARAGQMQDALVALRARTIDGPTASRIYHIHVPLGADGVVGSGAEALQRLRALPFVEFAEIVEEKP